MASHHDWGLSNEEWCGGTPDDADWDRCPVCGCDREWVDCWQCFGDGWFHDCGEDCCCCLDPEDDLNEPCPECQGRGGYRECPNLTNHPPATTEATDAG